MYAGDAALLERLPPRKELRRTRDLVRLSSAQIDDRSLVLETPWFGTDAADGESHRDSDGEDEEEAIGSGADEEEEVTDEEDGLAAESAESDGSEGSASEEEDDVDIDSGENAGADEEETSPDTHPSPAQKRKRPPSSLPPPPPPKPHSDPARPAKKKPNAPRARFATHGKGHEASSSHSRPTATMPSTKRANSGVPGTRAPVGASMRTRKPAANAPTTTAQKRKQSGGAADEDGAYDFSKFF